MRKRKWRLGVGFVLLATATGVVLNGNNASAHASGKSFSPVLAYRENAISLPPRGWFKARDMPRGSAAVL